MYSDRYLVDALSTSQARSDPIQPSTPELISFRSSDRPFGRLSAATDKRQSTRKMPGILPMKMIRLGSSNQSRIAQACDRCRSKKIRCDGIRPMCTQCSNVGFECKTSDKLSRRAFPRGYTESLEDRVRGLEAEVRELKELLDEKDEKIDMLSRIHNFSPVRKNSASLSPSNSAQLKVEVVSTHEEVLHVEIPAPVHPTTSSAGTSTTTALIEAFEGKVQEQGRSCPAIIPSVLLAPAQTSRSSGHLNNNSVAPPRLLSDQYISMLAISPFMNSC